MNIYSLFGIIFGLIVVPEYNVSEIVILTFYISRIKEGRPVKEIRRFVIMGILIAALIFILPLVTQVNNGIAEATGPLFVFTYTSLALEFLTIFILLILDHDNLKNRKYIPIYALTILGSLVFIIQIVTNLNYLINPALVLIVIFIYFIIENPDIQMV